MATKKKKVITKVSGDKPVGRPTKLTRELVDKAKGYLATCYMNPVELPNGGIKYVDVQLPKIVSLAIYLGIHKATVYEFCKETEGKENPLIKEFNDIVKDIDTAQEQMLVDGGLGGLFQPKTTGMLLGKHGYSDKSEVTGDTTVTHKIDIDSMLNKAYNNEDTE